MEQFFYELPNASVIADEALAFGKSTDVWHLYYNFEAARLPIELAIKEPMLMWLAKNRFDFHVGVLKLPPNTCYRWHSDTDRQVGINMLLEDNGSKCLFAENTEGVSFPTIELAYKPNKYYVFNTRRQHTVLNFAGTRYLLTVEFLGKDRGLTYTDICNVFKDNHGNEY
jgi:hypothetical protein